MAIKGIERHFCEYDRLKNVNIVVSSEKYS